jgi:hypothetical protein
MSPKTAGVLFVDRGNCIASLLVRAFDQVRPHCPIIHVNDGTTALNLLRGQDGQPGLPMHYVILLHLLQEYEAECFAFLQELRQDPVQRLRPVFVLGHSSQESDILAVYDFLVAGYLVITNIDEEYMKVVELLSNYIDVVEFPYVLTRP